MSGSQILGLAGATLGALVGVLFGFVVGEEERSLLLGLVAGTIGVPLGALLGVLAIYTLAGLLLAVGGLLFFLVMVIYVAGLAIAELLTSVAGRSERRSTQPASGRCAGRRNGSKD
jgi:hypothetical protein